jgi:hypothetical protein
VSFFYVIHAPAGSVAVADAFAVDLMTIEILPTDKLTADSSLTRNWNRKVASERNLYAMYQAPAWLHCLQNSGPPAQLVVARDGAGSEPDCLAVVARETVPLRYRVSRLQLNANLKCMELLGGRLLGSGEAEALERVTSAVFSQFRDVDGIYLKSVPDDAPLWSTLQAKGWRVGGARAYRPDGERPFHYAEFPPTFEGYLGEFRKKQRYNLKRQVRLMAEANGNSLVMDIIERPEQIDGFLADIKAITVNSWKADLEEPAPDLASQPELMRAVAAAGLLRGYVLRAAGKPAAYALGYRFENIYHYANIAYDNQFSTQSPGAVLLLMMIEDLIDKAQVKHMNFGITDANYKRVFGNRHIKDASVLIMRPGLRSSWLRTTHSAFESVKNRLRKRAGRAKPEPQKTEEES